MVSFSLLIILKPFGGGLVQPLPKRLPGVVYDHQNYAAGGGNGSVMLGMLCPCV